jgi:ribonucleoside-diphosphate reductase alpha chain
MTQNIYWLNKDSRKFLERGYLIEGETPEQRIQDIADRAQSLLGIEGFSDKFYDYMSKGYYSLSSPIWSNFGRERGLPISCFGSYIGDTMVSILEKVAEVGQMTKGGGGTSAYFGALRGRGAAISSGGSSTGSIHFMELYDKLMNVVSQGNVRRGSFAAYLPVDHPDIEEFLKIRGEGHEIQEMSVGVCVSDEWMKKMIDGDKQARKIWGQVIKKRFESGYPYIFFSDNANNQAPQVYKDKGLKINNSNLCNEIMLSNSEDESFVCDLSSLNLERWEEWKDTDAVEVLVYFLDAVMTEFIEKTDGIKFLEFLDGILYYNPK